MIFSIALFLTAVFFIFCGVSEDSETKEAALNISGVICFVGSFICASLDKSVNK